MELTTLGIAVQLKKKGYVRLSRIPTISQVLKWLREEKGIYVVIEPFPTMATKNKVHWSWSVKRYSDGAYFGHSVVDATTYATYEQATLAAIEYVVDKII